MKKMSVFMIVIMLLSLFSGISPNSNLIVQAVDNIPKDLKFDFGTATSPVEEGFKKVTNTIEYNHERGYGIQKENKFDYRDRKKPDDLRRDFIINNDYSFLVDVPNGEYNVKIIAGDAIARNNTGVSIEGENKVYMSSEEGEFEEYSGLISVKDGQLNIDLSDRVNGIEILQEGEDPTIDLKFDFGSDTSPVAGGYTKVTSTMEYSSEKGYGVQKGNVNSNDRGTPDNVRRDYLVDHNYSFLVDVPNGGYNITVISGDDTASNKTGISIEGKDKVLISSSEGVFEEYKDVIFVSDGQLKFDFSDYGIVNGIQIKPIPAPTTLNVKDIATTPHSSASITWDSVDGAESYKIYRKNDDESEFVKLANVDTNEFTDQNVELGLSYTYAVSSVFSGIESTKSSSMNVTISDETVSVPDAPELTFKNVTKDKVSFEWDSVKKVVSYYIYRSKDQGKTYEKLATSNNTSFTDESIITSKSFYYKVYAVNAGGLSEESNILKSPITTEKLRQMEKLDRAPVAVKIDEGILISWRLLGTDPSEVGFNVYREGELLTEDPITSSTNFVDEHGTVESNYKITPIVDGDTYGESIQTGVLANNHFDIPLNKPADGVTPSGESYYYRANDASVGDLDGDGQYELVVKWDPRNAKDNSQEGYTGNVYLDAYEFDGTQLWRMDLGVNIRAGAHYTQFIVYDFDGNGKAEVALKTADGTVDGEGNVIGKADADYRNSSGRIIKGDEFLTIFDGETGAALDTINYDPPRGDVDSWGDNYGNRVDRFLAGVAYLDGETPSLIMARGYYTRTVLVAYNFSNGKLEKQWTFDSDNEGYGDWAGQGYHSLSIADVDHDGKDEIVYGQITIDDDGTGLYNSGLGHGDALHVGDYIPSRAGQEIYAVQESTGSPYGYDMRDAETGEVLWGYKTGQDTGRGLTADIDPRYEGSEAWAISGDWNSDVGGIHQATGEKISNSIPSSNFAIWWDGDLLRELLDHDYREEKDKSGIGRIDKWDYENNRLVNLLRADGTLSNNGTKGTPALQADLFGDWREEVIWRTEDSSSLRVYLTPEVTEHRIYTLMHDPQYRVAVAWQNVGYNQPPHPSFFLGSGMEDVSTPQIYLRDKKNTEVKFQPRTLNLKSKGKSLTAKIHLSSKDLEKVGLTNIRMKVNGQSIYVTEAKRKGKTLSVEFDRQQVQEAFKGINGSIEVEILGYLSDGSAFVGRDTLKVIH